MNTNTRAIGGVLAVLLLLAGCTNATPEAALPETPVIEEPTPTASAVVTEPEQGEGTLVPRDYMPVIIPRTEIPAITIEGDYELSRTTVEDIYEWAASLAWLSINDSTLRGDPSEGDRLVEPLLPYLTDDASQQVLSAVRAWSQSSNPRDPNVLLSEVLEPMFFIVSPDDGGLGVYENDPIYSNVSIHKPTIARIDNNGTQARYVLSFDITAELYFRPNPDTCQDSGGYSCDALYFVGMAYPHDWEIVEAGTSTPGAYLLDSWLPASASYANLTPISE